ncbi:hypothetical protein THASP1DRAFT_29694, partial [Thamnocephalis sphaerospora]
MPGDPTSGHHGELGSAGAGAASPALNGTGRTGGSGHARAFGRARPSMVAPLPVDIPSKRMEKKGTATPSSGSVWGKPAVPTPRHEGTSAPAEESTPQTAAWRPKAAEQGRRAADVKAPNLLAASTSEFPTAAEAFRADTKGTSKPITPAVNSPNPSTFAHRKNKLSLDEKWDEMSDNGMDFSQDVIEFADGKVKISGRMSPIRGLGLSAPTRLEAGDAKLCSGPNAARRRETDHVGAERHVETYTRPQDGSRSRTRLAAPTASLRARSSDAYMHVSTTPSRRPGTEVSSITGQSRDDVRDRRDGPEQKSSADSSSYRPAGASVLDEAEHTAALTNDGGHTADERSVEEHAAGQVSKSESAYKAASSADIERAQSDYMHSAIERARRRREEEEKQEREAREKRIAERLRVLDERARLRGDEDVSQAAGERTAPRADERDEAPRNDTAHTGSSHASPYQPQQRRVALQRGPSGGCGGQRRSGMSDIDRVMDAIKQQMTGVEIDTSVTSGTALLQDTTQRLGDRRALSAAAARGGTTRSSEAGQDVYEGGRSTLHAPNTSTVSPMSSRRSVTADDGRVSVADRAASWWRSKEVSSSPLAAAATTATAATAATTATTATVAPVSVTFEQGNDVDNGVRKESMPTFHPPSSLVAEDVIKHDVQPQRVSPHASPKSFAAPHPACTATIARSMDVQASTDATVRTAKTAVAVTIATTAGHAAGKEDEVTKPAVQAYRPPALRRTQHFSSGTENTTLSNTPRSPPPVASTIPWRRQTGVDVKPMNTAASAPSPTTSSPTSALAPVVTAVSGSVTHALGGADSATPSMDDVKPAVVKLAMVEHATAETDAAAPAVIESIMAESSTTESIDAVADKQPADKEAMSGSRAPSPCELPASESTVNVEKPAVPVIACTVSTLAEDQPLEEDTVDTREEDMTTGNDDKESSLADGDAASAADTEGSASTGKKSRRGRRGRKRGDKDKMQDAAGNAMMVTLSGDSTDADMLGAVDVDVRALSVSTVDEHTENAVSPSLEDDTITEEVAPMVSLTSSSSSSLSDRRRQRRRERRKKSQRESQADDERDAEPMSAGVDGNTGPFLLDAVAPLAEDADGQDGWRRTAESQTAATSTSSAESSGTTMGKNNDPAAASLPAEPASLAADVAPVSAAINTSDASSGLLTPPSDSSLAVSVATEPQMQSASQLSTSPLPPQVQPHPHPRPPNSGGRAGKRHYGGGPGSAHNTPLHRPVAMPGPAQQVVYYAMPAVGSPRMPEAVPAYAMQGARPGPTAADMSGGGGWGVAAPMAPAGPAHMLPTHPQYMPMQYMTVNPYVQMQFASVPYGAA